MKVIIPKIDVAYGYDREGAAVPLLVKWVRQYQRNKW